MTDFEKVVHDQRDSDMEVFGCGDNPPSADAIRKFEEKFGISLPKDFVDFSCSRVGGVYVAVKEEFWPRAKPYDVGPFWSFLYGLHAYGFGEGIPDFMDIRLATPKFRERSRSDGVPCLAVIGDANVYCFNREGVLGRWDHETGEIKVIEKTFTEVLAEELVELKDRKVRKRAQPQS